ncbi:hypothetical protein PN462_21160 [Spirulina sp. CS-785/01]|uniref:hypothetical protein n=1 Tax=Spirulina sp. CS-785/01 TaxID=3021716 RepID=UPI0023306132|nr:hypothetical protein [Spirulina sp. CS-785/01]MDB9315636.1 hypothetical protein [Spirulina sp. CS-785/01]
MPLFEVETVGELLSAIASAHETPDIESEIHLMRRVYTLEQPQSFQPLYGHSGLFIACSLKIVGQQPNSIIQRVPTAPPFRLFFVAGEGAGGQGHLTLENVTLRGGQAKDGGGLMNVGGIVQTYHSIIEWNQAQDDGGGLLNVGTMQKEAAMEIRQSTLRNNEAIGEAIGENTEDGGGGIDNDGNKEYGGIGATLQIRESLLSQNRSRRGAGGGLRNHNGGTAKIKQSQIIHNTASFGAGVANHADLGLPPEPVTRLELNDCWIQNNHGIDLQDSAPQGAATQVLLGDGTQIGTSNV